MSHILEIECTINILIEEHDKALAHGNATKAELIMREIELELEKLTENEIKISTDDNNIVIH